ncbi:hypothetical protein E2C01_039278 [Portunus trituberculatus]|uniref:Uncharacterized protein n=1 Tax=Portunus trituberculatus TaxID=210409 RepID=A0A5B7FMJ7_PORTR|nr:hypothetical protein [Portunus trituberculatus]
MAPGNHNTRASEGVEWPKQSFALTQNLQEQHASHHVSTARKVNTLKKQHQSEIHPNTDSLATPPSPLRLTLKFSFKATASGVRAAEKEQAAGVSNKVKAAQGHVGVTRPGHAGSLSPRPSKLLVS